MRSVRCALVTALLAGPLPPALAGTAQADLTVQLDAPPTVAVPNEARIVAAVVNHGPGEASGIELQLALDEALVPMAIDAGPWGCTTATPLTCTLGLLAAGATAEVTLDVAVVLTGSLSAEAAVGQSVPDPEPTDDVSTVLLQASGHACDAVGTAGPDVLRLGTRGAVACGLRGGDVLAGGRGRQVLFGGPGRDTLGGGRGRDREEGGPGRDACAVPGGGCEVRGLARASSLPVFEVSPATVGYGYHQSLFGTAIGLRPFLPHRVMASRGRGTGATTAVDIVVPSRARVRAPATGTVVEVERYLLYCRTRDWKVVVAPTSHPRLRVVVLHMARPAVRSGDDVVAGSTILGRAARNDAPSAQVNRYFPSRYPHVHVEVERRRASPTPGCDL